MEDVVAALVLTRLFQGHQVGDALHHAQHPLVPPWVGAEAAQCSFGQRETPGAQPHLALHLLECLDQPLGVLRRGAEDVKGQTLGGLFANAGQLGELGDQSIEWVRRHPVIPGIFNPPETLDSSCSLSCRAWDSAALTAAATRSSIIPTSPAAMTSGEILMLRTSPAKVATTFTRPSPA